MGGFVSAMRCSARASALACVVSFSSASAQPTGDSVLVPPQNGPRVVDPGRHLIIGGTVHLSPGETIPAEQVPIIRVEDGRIAAVIEDSRVVALDTTGFRVWTLGEDDHIYAGFLEPWFEVDGHELDSHRPGGHWSPNVLPGRDVLDGPGLSAEQSESLRGLGFVAAAIAPDGGIFRGLGAVVSTGVPPENEASDGPTVHMVRAFETMDFIRSGWGGELTYPTSQMGAVALIRQVFYDAIYHQKTGSSTGEVASNALDSIGTAERVFFETDHELEVFQADALAREFQRDIVVVGSGREIRRVEAIASTSRPIVLPLLFPRKPDVDSVGEAERVELETMMLWEQAPTTAARLIDAGATVALTSSKRRSLSAFHDDLRTAVEHGLDPVLALAGVTTVPAEILGLSDRFGVIEAGRPADLVVTSGPLFDPDDEEAEIRDVWIGGLRHEISRDNDHPFEGRWILRVGDEQAPDWAIQLSVDGDKIELVEERQPDEQEAEPQTVEARGVSITGDAISFLVDGLEGRTGTYVMSGVLTRQAEAIDRILGSGLMPDGSSFAWHAVRDPQADAADDEPGASAEEDAPEPGGSYTVPAPIRGVPFGPYAVADRPEPRTLMLINATVWTSGPGGVIERGYVSIEDGVIVAVGEVPEAGLDIPEGFEVINLDGAHLTPGLIDAHSHTGTWTFGTNEAGQAITAEVRMADTSDPDHINWYRQLAAGVTTVNTLHGSANVIGGQNVIQKVRWGVPHPRDMHMQGATPGIKFALGENVVQVNWGDRYTTRYPKTRMGVDSLLRDRFTAAQAYAARWHAFLSTNSARPEWWDVPASLAQSFATVAGDQPVAGGESLPRRDLELDPLVEVLAGDRLVHCHSYRQDEIVMLANVARDFGFTIGSYQHGLETYKVAESVKAHSLGGSLFSDWWAYKVEVQDAIPHAGPILYATGTPVSFNSDSDNLVRRMNTEAAKMIKYGKDLGPRFTPSPSAALDVVTIVPARQLGIDERVGSIEAGKDADLTVWSGDPLSSFSRVLHTFIDGREYWSESIDAAHRDRIASERARLIAKLIESPSSEDDGSVGDDGSGDGPPEAVDAPPDRRITLAERIRIDALRAHHRALWLEGRSLGTPMQPGDCGCGMSHMGMIR